MITNAVSLAVISFVGIMFLYKKLPRKIRRWLKNHPLFTDTVAFLMTYAVLGATVTALMAAGLLGILVSAMLFIANNPEEFEFLEDFTLFLKEQVNKLKKLALEFGQEYRERKLENVC